MFSLPFIIAQAAAEDPEVTVPMMIASLIVVAAMGGSLAMLASWAVRRREGRPVFPAAFRKPLIVPLPLLGGGIVMTILMALMVLATSAGDATSTSESGDTSAETEASEDVTEANDVEVATVDEASEDPPKSTAQTEARMQTMMLQTMTLNGMLLGMFGIIIWLSQQTHSRKLSDIDDVTYTQPTLGGGSAVAATVGAAASATDTTNPYTPPGELSELEQARIPENPFLADGGGTEGSSLPLERWDFATEFRFAGEAVLAAYLPTALIRVGILQLLPDAPSHPFLELMEEGVAVTTLLLIMLMAVVVAPIVEELLYRVTILGGFMQQKTTTLGWVLSSVLFGFAHGFPDSIALLPLAAVIGYTYIRRRSYRTVILIHLLFNAFNMVIAGIGLM